MSQRALRSHRTKTWQRSGPLPGPGMHRGVGPIFLLGRNMAASGAEPQILVQYLVLRKDLSQTPFSWPAGALVAQACHAATAALHIHRDHPHTVAYLRELGRMRKVVLEAPDETTLKLLAETLQQKNIDHMLWLEQPENIATCVALRPYPKEEVNQYLKKFRLFK
ncbi:putative peptidyl-tRNA hydrolase PTRHD1 [Equus quagga]|uniref:putative peptidyl-tRNA hydrolase PTRHD1 n=1 Tax=Equus quagga TaxID=89248 RepID=UPI001EE3879A|nr:putative peptidyl-tRNA hydrolase PTRHD1 [Equus quagga]